MKLSVVKKSNNYRTAEQTTDQRVFDHAQAARETGAGNARIIQVRKR
jgi:hypothetical protein